MYFIWEETLLSIGNGGSIKVKRNFLYSVEGYASGEMKHGPIALVDEKLPIVFIAPKNHLSKIFLI